MDFTKNFYSETTLSPDIDGINAAEILEGFASRRLEGKLTARELVENYLKARTQLAAMGYEISAGSWIDFEKEYFHVSSVKTVLGTMGSPEAEINFYNWNGAIIGTFPKSRFCETVQGTNQ